MKKIFRIIHLYLGLAAGVVIMISCITGAILVFEDELTHALNHNRYYSNANSSPLTLDQLIKSVEEKVTEGKTISVKIYADKLRTAEIGIAIPEMEVKKEQKDATQKGKDFTSKGSGGKKDGASRATHAVFVNRYTGAVVEVYNHKETFFYQVFTLHRWLLGSPKSIGKVITGVSVCIFFFILLTGIILWWPKSALILKQRLNVRWDGSFKRLNHDLHIVLGFYASVFLFVIVLSAMSLAHEWFNDGIFKITNSSKENPEPPQSQLKEGKKRVSFNDVYLVVSSKIKDAEYYSIRKPKDSVGVFSVSVLPNGAMGMAVNTYYIDQYTAGIKGSLLFEDKNAGQKIKSSMKSIHTGTFLGIPSKILWLIVSLLGFSFPITGLIMWLKRIKKRKTVSNH